MIASAEINLLNEIQILELLKKSGVDSRKMRALQQTFHHIMSIHTLKTAIKPKRGRKQGYVDILMYDLDADNVPLILTGALLEVFEQDIVTALSIANLFGDEICLAVDILTAQKSRHLTNDEYYDFVAGRFNYGNADTENSLMSTVVILMMVSRISKLKKLRRQEAEQQQALLNETLQSFISQFRNRLDMANFSPNLFSYFQSADVLLKSFIESNIQQSSLIPDIESSSSQCESIPPTDM